MLRPLAAILLLATVFGGFRIYQHLNSPPMSPETVAARVGAAYGDAHPKLVHVVSTESDGPTHEPMYVITASGHFHYRSKSADYLIFSALADRKFVWAVWAGDRIPGSSELDSPSVVAGLALHASDLGKPYRLIEEGPSPVSELALTPSATSQLRRHGLLRSYRSGYAAELDRGQRTEIATVWDGIDEYRNAAGARWAYQHLSQAFRSRAHGFKTGNVVAASVGEQGMLYVGSSANKSIFTVEFERGRFAVVVSVDGPHASPSRALRFARVIDARIKNVRRGIGPSDSRHDR